MQVLTNDEFQHLRIKKACALVEPRKGCIKDAALLTATEEQRFDMLALPYSTVEVS